MKYCLDARTATAHFPGIGRYVRSLVPPLLHQLEKGEVFEIIEAEGLWQKGDQDDANLHTISTTVSPFSFSQQWHIPGILKASRPALYHSPYYLMAYWLPTPVILTVYDLIPLLFPATVSLQARMFFRLATWQALRSSAHIIAISEATRQDFIKTFHLPENKITAIPLAASPIFRPQPSLITTALREKYHLPERFVLYLGINKPHKNLCRLLLAWKHLVTDHAVGDTRLVFAGAWDERYPEVKQQITSLGLEGKVRLLGPVPEADLPAFYSAARLFVFPSLYEGFGLPVLEALACGLPVACAATSSLPEVAGQAALLFDPLDISMMASAIQKGLNDENTRQVLIKQGFIQASKFSWEKTAAQTLAVYRQISKSPASSGIGNRA